MSVGELPWSDAIPTILVRVELPKSVHAAAILQQLALLYARPSPYSADGGETALLGRYTAYLRAFGIVGTYGHSSGNAASSTTVGSTVPL